MFERLDHVSEPLYIVTSIFNAVRFRSRWRLYHDFVRMVEASGAILYTVEVAFGNRDFAVTEPNNPHHLQLRTCDELWHKERALNLLIQRLPADWKYMAWVDADVSFARGDWANEIIQQLQHYAVLQPFSQAIDLSPQYEILNTFRSFAWSFLNDIPSPVGNYYGSGKGEYKGYWHPGFAQAWNRWAFDVVGGLLDICVLGGADLFMWRALTGIDRHLPDSMGLSGIKAYKEWRNRADDMIKQNIGYCDGLLLHYWHGNKAQRRYKDRGQILVDAHFDPATDLFCDSQGLYQLNKHNIQLRDEIRKYFRERNEDSVDIL